MKYLIRALGTALVVFLAAFTAHAQPANNNFAEAWTLTGALVTTNGNSANANKETGEPNHAGNAGARSVWFNWTAPSSGQIRLDTVGSAINTLLAVYTGNAVNALTLVAANDNGPGIGNASLLEFQAAQGTTYRIAIDVFNQAPQFPQFQPQGGQYVLNLRTLATIAISSPTNGATFLSGDSIAVNVSGDVPTPPITRVEFYRLGTLFASDTNAPFNAVAPNSPAGSNSLYVVALDSGGIRWTSAVVNVLVKNVGVTLLSPAEGSIFANTAPITVTALADLPAGSITNIEFFADGVRFGQDATAPFSAVWTNVTGGTHRLTAIGRSDSGVTYNSQPVNIGVAQLLIPSNSVWRYLDDGSNQGTNWAQRTFDDGDWKQGPAELGYGDGDEATVVEDNPTPGYNAGDNNRYITTYFRHGFVLQNAAAFSSLVFAVERDDAAVVYVNGVEVFRSPNLPAAPTPILFNTLATGQGIEDTVDTFVISAQNLVNGYNAIAVEIHQQAANSSDISFNLQLLGTPVIIRNQLPTVALTSPTNNAPFVAPSAITLNATASDADGSVTNVEFFADNVKIGQDSTSPYSVTWNSPGIGTHVLHAVATDDQGGTQSSSPVNIAVYNSAGTPLAQITSPAHGTVVEGPTNLTITATANALTAVTNVQFLVNGSVIGNDTTSPYSLPWNAPFGSNALHAVAYDTTGARGTSALVSVIITIPPTNTVAPTIAAQVPVAGASLTNITSIQVAFSERVSGVNASDLLINGVPATNVVANTSSNYTFTFPQPAYGTVNITWAANHGIQDFGFPSNLAFNATAPGAAWNYTLLDRIAPTIIARDPVAGASVTNLTQVTVTFSEAVTGVDAADLLVNGTPAFGLTGGGANYTFSFATPAPGTVNVGWATTHGITDLAASPNPFNATAAGATWTYFYDTRTVLVQSNSAWLFIKARAEASTPIGAWRQIEFDDSGWSNALAPFYYGDPYNTPTDPGTLLSDMLGGYSSIYLRKTFVLPNASAVTNLFFNVQIDDGFIAWINGVEILRVNAPAGDVPYNGEAPGTAQEVGGGGAPYILYTNLPSPYLVNGVNVLAVHALNNQPNTSSDFGFNAQLFAFIADPALVAPVISSVTPPAGTVFSLTNLTVRFSEGVTGVNASDLLINGVPATSVTSSTNTTYTFSFARPAFGPVLITWAAGHGIADLDSPPKAFDASAPGASFQYSFVNPSAPTVASQSPLANATVTTLTQLSVTFSEVVTGVNASDLLVNGVPATGVSGSGANYTFTFAQPAYGTVLIGWAGNHGIRDVENPANDFDGARQGNVWSYTLLDQLAPTIASKNPFAGAQVTNLTQITVTFSEAVTGVNASDMLVNGVPATGLTGTNATYTFAFGQPNATTVNISWVNNHGIRDLAPVPNSFDATAPGATWTYTTPDTLAPSPALIDPPPFVTVRSLTQIRVTFTEPVIGVGTNDLLVNGQPARSLSGSGAGPYTFTYLQPSNGVVDVRWVPGHGIVDLASPPNAFAGGEWNYIIDPNATFAGKVIINEIMFNPTTGRPADEWIELRNVTSSSINLTGWRIHRGVNFTFPNVAIPANGYLVVAANVAAFQANYPGVTNLVGGWSGSLANSEETISLETALGENLNSVHYATQGDWAQRERGNDAERVESITRNGTTATVRIFAHGFTSGGGGGGGGNADQIIISGADQPEYNGRFTIANAAAATFTITVPNTAATPATGNIIARRVADDGVTGWFWFSAADGFGNSLELVNSALPNNIGQNWLTSTNLGGTPGRANSVAAVNVAPLIQEVTHFPLVPRSTDTVTITARVRDEQSNGVASVTLFYRNHTTTTPGAFISTNMFDDGAHGDGGNRDGIYGAVLPASANGTVIEFYVQATDSSSLSRTWPAPTWDTNNTSGQLANALYQVDDEVITNAMPAVRLVMTGSERAIFPPNNRNSDALRNVTFIGTEGDETAVRYLGGVRIRGAGSRTRTPPNNRVNLPNDRPWMGRVAMNLNGQFVHAQLMGAAVAQKSGLPSSDANLIQYRINGVNPAPIGAPVNGSGNGAGYGTFIMIRPVNGDLAEEMFPEDGGGNVYRASTGNHSAQLNHQGTNPDLYLQSGYFKTSNATENDWTDMFNLTFAFAQVPNEADYLQAISTNVNVLYWMRYFAVGTLVNFGETSMFNGRGDDYALYRGEKDPRFVAIGHDFDTIFGQGDTLNTYNTSTNSSIYIMLSPPNTGGGNQIPNMPLLRRFMTNAAFAPIFFSELKRLADTVFSPAQLNPLMDQLLTGWGNGPTETTIDAMKAFAAGRRAAVLSQIPLTLTISNTLSSSNGFLFTTTPNVTLYGTSHAIDTRRVLVRGVAANWAAWDARWTNSVTLQPGINRVAVQSLDSNNVEFARGTVDIWYDDGSIQSVSGTLATDTAWTAAQGPYQVSANLTVAAGATLTIQPGTTVYLSPGVNIVVANGGRLIADGNDAARIRFSPAPGAGNWGGMTINGGPNSPESRIAYAHFAGNNSTAIQVTDGTVFLDHLTFGNTARQYVSLDRASFVVQDCVFPATTAAFEPVHGSGGIKAGGRGIFLRNFWGKIIGYNDSLDFTGGNRPGPIVQIINNVFMGSDDDLLDLDSTDAWVEGNIFFHTHRNGSPDSASAISGGADNADTSQITVIGNLFYDVDQAALAKQGNFYTMINNTIVRQSRIGSQDTNAAVVILADDGTTQGAGIYLEGNIIHDAENLTRNVTTALVTYTNNIIHQLAGAPWTGAGGGNVNADPLLKRIPPFSETTNFNSWAAAQVMWDYFSLRPGSPASGTGPNGRDKGGVIPLGVSISGEPVGTTPFNSAVLRVDPPRTGNGIPTNGFPNGSGFTHYRWRLDGGAWSAETPSTTPITLNGLSAGEHFVEVSGKRDSGFYQDDPVFGADGVVTVSRLWAVNSAASPLRINEILASNSGAVNHNGTTPDVVELYNASDAVLNIAGFRLTDDASNPDKFIFPAGATVPARGYLVVFANNPDGTPGYHLGFGLNQSGDSLYLYNAAANGGALLDSVEFGLQLTDRSIGRLADGTWALTQPTFGALNRAAQLGDPRALRINEWLALGRTPFDTDFVELYNTDPLPVNLGGLYFSDNLIGWPDRHRIPALSFIGGNAYLRFAADGDPEQGADHLNFALSSDHGVIALSTSDLLAIDSIWYQAQRPNISQGRAPNGGSAIVFFNTPTPGAPNPNVTGPPPFGGALVINEVLANNANLAETIGTNNITPDWVEIYNGTAGTINLANLSLTDNPAQPRRFVFAAGTQLPPGGYLRIFCADSQPPSANNTGFGLSSSGGGVYLFNDPASGGALINAIVYGIQTPDLSIGRVPSGGTNWVLTTPTPNAANAAVPTFGAVGNLRINEWLADPVSGEDDWFELYNPNSQPVALGGLFLTDDLNARTKHQIAPLSFIGSGTNAWVRFVADGNTGAGADHVNFSLRAAGEALGISTVGGALIDGVTFGAQLTGVSEGRFTDGATNVVSFPGTASPGRSNYRLLTTVAINEVLTHTDLPLEDAIELRNLTGAPIDITGWWLSDDRNALLKYQIPSPTVIPANGFVVIYETRFTNFAFANVPFALSSGGDEVVLSATTSGALNGFRTSVDFGAAANGVSFGRYVTSDGREQFVAMAARTFGMDDPATVAEFRTGTGKTNSYPRVGPVVISEVMYHPPDIGTNDNTRDEFIELRNITTAPVQLFDPANPANVWRLRDAVDFDFPPNTVIPAGGTLLVVSFDPVNNASALAAFRGTYRLSASQPIVGPYSGRLANDTDDIELRRPDAPNGTDIPSILVERVRYLDNVPWPAAADGTGFSLQRVSDTGFANDPTNWVAAAPTPGPVSASQDSDGDGMPDSWENTYGFDPLNPFDANLDADGDGLTNLSEYRAGTHPRDATSGVRFDSVALSPSQTSVLLTFRAASNVAYTVESVTSLGGTWQVLQSYGAVATNRVIQVTQPAAGTGGFYRLRSP